MTRNTVSIIICTANRSAHLQQTLASLAAVEVPADMRAELLVVDNASTDATADVVHACRLPQMPTRYVLEPRRGKGYAYNTGMAQAQGDLFLFTDDDVRPPANWIAGMAAPLASGKAHALAGGVKLAPHLLREWMTPLHRAYLASTELLAPKKPQHIVGANMAFSREVLSRVPAFDVELGPGALGLNEEGLFGWQLREAGYEVAAALDVTVEHNPEVTRLQHAKWLDIAVKDGASMAYIDYHWKHQTLWNSRRFRMKQDFDNLLWRCKKLVSSQQEGATQKELEWTRSIAYYQQMKREEKRPRNYEKHGLVKLSHV